MNNTITYLAGGLLGDFINTLSVIQENYIKTGKKGVLYISNQGDSFRMGVEQVFKDTYDIIIQQEYISNYFIYNNEPCDINLSYWRYYQEAQWKNWYLKYKATYQVEWGTHIWLSIDKCNFDWEKYTEYYSDSSIFKNKTDAWNHWVSHGKKEGRTFFKYYENDNFAERILINTTSYRFPIQINFAELYEKYGDKLLFIGFEEEQYNYFKQQTGLEIEFYKPETLLELSCAIQMCEMFVGSMSAPLHFALAMHKKIIIGLCNMEYHSVYGHHLVEGLKSQFSNINF